MYEDLKMRVLSTVFNIAGSLVTTHFDGETNSKKKTILDDYHKKMTDIARKIEKERVKEKHDEVVVEKIEEKREEKPPEIEITKDMTPEKIEKGTACLACSRDHFSTASSMLNEALRFKKEGMGSWEVQRRLGIALDEYNAMERGDLHADQIEMLSGQEKDIANDALDSSREIRHKITAIRSVKDLEDVSAQAANARTKFMKDIFSLSITDGTVNKLCQNFSGNEKERCLKEISSVFYKKHG